MYFLLAWLGWLPAVELRKAVSFNRNPQIFWIPAVGVGFEKYIGGMDKNLKKRAPRYECIFLPFDSEDIIMKMTKHFFWFWWYPIFHRTTLWNVFLQIIIILCLMVWYGTIWCGMISYGMRRYDAIWWCGMALDIWDDKTMLNKLNMSIYTLSYQYTHHLSTRCHICTIC